MEVKQGKINIAKLKRAEYNPRFMPDEEMSALVRSIDQFGFVEFPVANSNPERYGMLIGGHQRTAALERLISNGRIPTNIEVDPAGGYFVPVMFVDLNLEQEKALNLALNKIRGKWDDEKLAMLIVELKESTIIPATGFRDDEISRILDATLPGESGENGKNDPDETKEARSQFGEVYQLGTHRLICGDSTDLATYEKLFGGEEADMVFTDPPYNVAYKSRGGKLNEKGVGSIKNDDMSAEKFREFIDGAFSSMLSRAKTGASFYICSGWSSYPQFLESMVKHGFQHSGVIIWVKNTPSMGWNDYRYKHEWIAKAKKVDVKTAEGIIYGWKNGTHHFNGENEFDVWEMPRKSVQNYLHPTEKPDWLAMRALRNSTKRGDIVLDPFGGSGSTMAAAEKTGRRAYMIELDPKFCDVIRDRWERIERQKIA
jgi:DNA modification methylase